MDKYLQTSVFDMKYCSGFINYFIYQLAFSASAYFMSTQVRIAILDNRKAGIDLCFRLPNIFHWLLLKGLVQY